MKIAFKILILISIISSCKRESQTNLQEKKSQEIRAFSTWKQEYKNVAFQRCMFLGFNRSTEIRNLLKIDRSTAKDFPFGLNQYRYIDTIVQPIIAKAKLDSTIHYNKFLKGLNHIEGDELNRLPMTKYCLEYYTSHELDSISNKRVEQMKFLWKTRK